MPPVPSIEHFVRLRFRRKSDSTGLRAAGFFTQAALVLFLNGEFISEDSASISIHDRGFLYGDGLFETMAVHHRQPVFWEEHMCRFVRSCQFLKIPAPDADQLRDAAARLCRDFEDDRAVLRLSISRGAAPRGYAIPSTPRPTVLMQLHPFPATTFHQARWRLHLSSHRVAAGDPLLQHKTGNKLLNVLAKSEATEAGMDESLILNSEGHITCASGANLFWIENERLFTPPVEAGLLPGIIREKILDAWAPGLGMESRQDNARPDRLVNSQGCFLTNSVIGIVPVVQFNQQPIPASPLCERLQTHFQQLLNTLQSEG